MTKKHNWDSYPVKGRIRRLTPTECERLQGFPEIEKYVIIKVCLGHQKNLVFAEKKNLKLPKLAGSAENSDFKESVVFVDRSLLIRNQQTEKPVQPDVLINCAENGVEIHNQEKSLLNAIGAEKKSWCHQHINLEDFVRLVVGINIIKERITGLGEVGSRLNVRYSTHQKNGNRLVRLFGNEMMRDAGCAKKDLITLNALLKFITSSRLDTENLELRLITLSSFVIRAISGYIPDEIKNRDTFTIGIKTKVGWTFGISDSQRYKCLGNAVTVNVIQVIAKQIMTFNRTQK